MKERIKNFGKKLEHALVCAAIVVMIAVVLAAAVWQMLKALIAFIVWAALFVLLIGLIVWAIHKALEKDEEKTTE